MLSKPTVNQAQYTETEAAQQLDVSIEELRVLIRQHIVVDEADAGNVPITTFQPSDLLVLRVMRKAGGVSQVA